MSKGNDVTQRSITMNLNGEPRTIRMGMSAWLKIQEKYEGLDGLGNAMKKDQPNVIVDLISFGLKKKTDDEVITREKIADALDEYDIGELIGFAEKIMQLVQNSLPDHLKNKLKKADGDPTKAE